MSFSIGSRIRNIRGKESRSIFSQKLGIGTATLQRYENDERSPDIDFLTKLQLLTGYSLDYLVYGKESVIPTDEALILEKYRQADEATKNKMLMLLLGGSEATANVAIEATHTGSGVQNNAKIQNINNAPSTTNQTKIKIGKQNGDVVNGDKHVTK